MKGRHFCRPNLHICEKTEVPSVGGDAHIAPPGVSLEWLKKTDTPIPSAPRADVGIGPYEKQRAFPA